MPKPRRLPDSSVTVKRIVEDLYKKESARLLSVLTRIFGVQNLALAEDVLQEAFSRALTHWLHHSMPQNPSAWIITSAKHLAIDAIRANKTKLRFANDLTQHLTSEWSLGSTVDQQFCESSIRDDQLRLIFMCCHETIKPQNRIPFILKTLCGFSVDAIARALLLSPVTVKKRLFRTRQQLKTHHFELPVDEHLAPAMDSVHTVLYLLFNEGFHCSASERRLKLEFCQEAVGLLNLLVMQPNIANQDTLGLFALMHFHIARLESRIDQNGANIPLDLQDRSLWKQEYLGTARHFLEIARQFPAAAANRFYLEALIANAHCQAPRFEDTDWQSIVNYYSELIELTNSPLARLNQAIAIAYNGELPRALAQAQALLNHRALKHSPMPFAILAHLHALDGNAEQAHAAVHLAIARGSSGPEQRLMMQQIERRLRPTRLALH